MDEVRADPVLAATENATLPRPEPLAPAVMVTHGEELVALHAQPEGAVTATVLLPPAMGIERLVG